ncbi:hypothetical protein CHS0354_010769 [Potamilus streckersoni]|uniref:Thioredoxin domain-containing protein n=1 Tax=Potamilus streckersoni TaxID=2493646 RepID=A0AAE0TA53_9BIVA|nr:hypothetical protein CHS0354_010769 [Potamilus streckersoni]
MCHYEKTLNKMYCSSGPKQYTEIAKEFSDAIFLKVDVDEVEDVAANCGISAMPTFQFYKNGKKVNELVGANETKLREMIEKMLGKDTMSKEDLTGLKKKRKKMVRVVQNKADFEQLLHSAGNKLVVVDFYATWCGPCRFISPKLERMSKEFTDAIFLKVDVDEVEEVAENCGISAMPTFQFYKHGEKVDEFIGANETKLKEMLVKNLK